MDDSLRSSIIGPEQPDELAGRAEPARTELWTVVCLGLPSFVTSLCRTGMLSTDQAFLGHLSTDDLAAAGYAGIWVNLTTAMLLRGIGSAVQTLSSQAYGGGRYKMVGHWLQMSLVTMWIGIVPVATSWLFVGDILGALGYDQDIVDRAALFARLRLCGIIGTTTGCVLENSMMAMQMTTPQMFVNGSCLFLNAALNLVLVSGAWTSVPFFLGFIGSPISTAISRTTYTIGLLVYCLVAKVFLDKWHGWSWVAFRGENWKVFLRQAVPALLATLVEEISLQLVALFAAKLGKKQLAAHSAFFVLFLVLTSAMFGLSGATTVRIGYHLGKKDIAKAKQVMWLCLRCSFGMSLVVASVLISCGKHIGRAFTDDEQVIEYVSEISVIAGAAYTLIALFYTGLATLNGQGRRLPVLISFLTGSLVCLIPAAYILAFNAGLGVRGLWMGMALGYAATSVMVWIFLIRSDWDAIVLTVQANLSAKQEANSLVVDEETKRMPSDLDTCSNDKENPLLIDGPGSVLGIPVHDQELDSDN